MESLEKEVSFCGLENHQGIIDGIIRELHIEDVAFDVKLILVEAVMNAYYHGNLSDRSKPISIRYSRYGSHLQLQVEDCGEGLGDKKIPSEVNDDDLLQETGRGLFLIRCFSDRVHMIRNVIYIEKNLTSLQ
ncbi:ATP-binding protein [Paenibacillus sp. sgz500958]|uniref:ATP-binding protein n=1 Tax=Paenibacillus sp. sgz500958 TaxID=3242475 RepID=UPI0036D2C905